MARGLQSWQRFPMTHRFAGVLALIGVVASSSGVVMLPEPPPDWRGAYPCQGGRCGCTGAEQCWRSCCCTTLAERLQWAEQNGVAPPEFIQDQLASKELQTSQPRSCCSATESCAVPQAAPGKVAGKTRTDPPPIALALLDEVNRCRGLASYLAIFGAAICEPIAEPRQVDLAPGEWLQPADELLVLSFLTPPTPPPRISA